MTADSPWFVCFRRVEQPRLRLFCFPFAGGGAASYRLWHQQLPTDVEIWAVRPPGREIRYREPAFFRIGPLVDAVAAELEDRVDLPYALFGHSLGALIAFETARRLEREGHGPAHLFVAAHRAPHLPPQVMPVHVASDDVILARLRRFGGTPQAFYDNPDLVEALLPNMRRDFAVSETYRFTDPTTVACAVTAFGGADDHTVDATAIEEWRSVTNGTFRSVIVAGGHFFWSTDASELLLEVGRELRAIGAPTTS